jgi:hypothetical protein
MMVDKHKLSLKNESLSPYRGFIFDFRQGISRGYVSFKHKIQ